MLEVLDKLDVLLTQKKGWDGYNADPFLPSTIEAAKNTARMACGMGFPPTFVAASGDPSVMVAWRPCPGVHCDLEFWNDGEVLGCISLEHYPGGKGPEIWDVEDAEAAIEKIREALQA
jgi:hypothetical protein